jgi:hypothetical protein
MCLLLFCLCPSLSADAFAREQIKTSGNPTDAMIRLGRSHFDPLSTDRTSNLRSFRSSKLRSVDPFGKELIRSADQTREDRSRPGYYIVQFDGPVLPAWKNALSGRSITPA